MPLVEQLYCTQQINVPPTLPTILKQFCKAAIRTQPYDLLKWSSTYFRAMADGEEPPIKLRLEYPPPSTPSGLTPGFLKVLFRQFGDYNKILSLGTFLRRWDGLCLERKDSDLIILAGGFRDECQVKKFLAIAVGLLGNSLLETMIMVCELFTHDPEGSSAMIPVTLFMEIYGYLAGLHCDGTRIGSSDDGLSDLAISHDPDQRRSSVYSKTMNASNGSGKLAIEYGSIVSSQDIDYNESSANVSDRTAEVAEADVKESKMLEEHTDRVEGIEVNRQKEDQDSINSEEKGSPASGNRDCVLMEKVQKLYESGKGESISLRKIKMEPNVKKRMITLDSASVNNCPNVPGIGPRLSAEQVANVALWMTECARCQEGMVGPRNVRHFQCPPLDVKTSQS